MTDETPKTCYSCDKPPVPENVWAVIVQYDPAAAFRICIPCMKKTIADLEKWIAAGNMASSMTGIMLRVEDRREGVGCASRLGWHKRPGSNIIPMGQRADD